MKSFLLLLVAVFSLSACKQKPNTIIVAGDSWSFLVCRYKSLDTALERVGIFDAGQHSTCAATSLVGMLAEKWKSSTFHKTTRAALLDPSVKAVYLSLGGNDVMDYWHKDMTPTEEQAVFERIRKPIAEAIADYRKLRPDVKILVSGYDYSRFTPNHPIPQYQRVYAKLGSPTPVEMNEALIRFSKSMAELADQKNVFYIHHLGLMHYHNGNTEASLAPQTTLAPEHISSPSNPLQHGGDLHLLNDSKSMAKLEGYGLSVVEPFHLTKFGYDRIADHSVRHYLKDWFSKSRK